MTTIISIVALLLAAAPAWAFDAEQTFKKGTFMLSGEGAYGWQFNSEHKRSATYVEFYDAGVRFSLLPLDTIARRSFLYGALEVGLEPLYQHYTTPKQAFWAGLAAVGRYHFLALGRVVPYAEVGGAANAAINVTLRETSSANSAGNLSGRPAAQSTCFSQSGRAASRSSTMATP